MSKINEFLQEQKNIADDFAVQEARFLQKQFEKSLGGHPNRDAISERAIETLDTHLDREYEARRFK